MRSAESIWKSVTMELYQLLMRYSPMVIEDGVSKVEYRMGSGRKVVVRNPIRSLAVWKLFLYCLWQSEEEEELSDSYRLRVPLWAVKVVLRKPRISVMEIAVLLEQARDVEYVIYEEDQDRKERVVHSFRLFPKLKIVERGEDGYMDMHLDKEFYQFCMQEGLLLYVPFVKKIQSPTAMNLFMWLSTRQDEVFREEVLIERSGLSFRGYPDFVRRQELKKALDLLVKIEFIKGWSRLSDGRYYIHRYPVDLLKAKAKDLAKHFQIEDDLFIQDQREKDRLRKKRARVEKSNKKPTSG